MLLKLHHPRAHKTESWRQFGQSTPSSPISRQLEAAKKPRIDSSSGEWKMRPAVWDHFSFTKLSDVKGEYEANCEYCNNTHYKEWSFERKAFSITCDNARAMDVMVARLKWNSTYLMLKRALEAKDALVFYVIVDTSFHFSLTSEQWTIVLFVCRFLSPFHSITELFSGSDYPTANLYFVNSLAIEKLLVLGNTHEVDSIKK
ncbi:putative AC transposase [Bienertia sinuspersici]